MTNNVEIKFTFSTALNKPFECTVTSGAFPVSIHYLDKLIGQFQILVIQPQKISNINNYISKMGWNSYYEASLLCLHGSNQKSKTVYVYLTDKQMIIREFYLKLIPHRLAR